MLSRTTRLLTFLTAILYAVTGVILFFGPESLAPIFAWNVTPLMTMTIGAWCLGNAWLAWISAYRWKWRQVYTALIYLWLFGLVQTGVVITFRDKLKFEHPIAWLYLLSLAVNVLTALAGFFDWLRIRPTREGYGPQVGAISKVSAGAFILFVGFLAAYGMVAPLGAPGTNAGIFPETMSLFTLRAFAGFYLSLSLAAIPLLTERNISTFLHHSVASYGLIILITAAALVYLGIFDFANRPGGLIYLGAYLVVGIPLLFVFWKKGLGAEHA